MKTGVGRGGVRMPVNRSFERELAHLEAMSGQTPDVAGIERVRRALGNENNYLVAKAARIVSDHALTDLLPEVLSAFDRFFVDAVKKDPQCWAKNALIKALVALECRDAEIYLRGLRHRQEEPVWGGHSDTAGTLRATCTQALVSCRELNNEQLLTILLEPLVDADKSVRMEAARAIGHVGGSTAFLLLKLRVMLRKDDPEVLGACFAALLGMAQMSQMSQMDQIAQIAQTAQTAHSNRAATIALVAEFLDDGEEAAAEAAFALAETHDPAALHALIGRRRKGADAWFGSVLDHAIVLTRLPEGMEFLLEVIEADVRQAPSALEAISRVHHSEEVRARVSIAVAHAQSERVLLAFQQYFPAESAASADE